MNMDRYAAAESYHKLAMAFAPVPDLHIMWLLHLCDAHQEMQSWAEAAQCAVAVAGVVMQVHTFKLSNIVTYSFFKQMYSFKLDGWILYAVTKNVPLYNHILLALQGRIVIYK